MGKGSMKKRGGVPKGNNHKHQKNETSISSNSGSESEMSSNDGSDVPLTQILSKNRLVNMLLPKFITKIDW